jgi:hypothetical protein
MTTNWPALPYEQWKQTRDSLHLWTQIIGKIRTARSPWLNHAWHVTLYVTARGLTTSPIPFEGGIFEIELDFVSHRVEIRTSRGAVRRLDLEPESVARFYSRVLGQLAELDIEADFSTLPNEIPDAIRFEDDVVERAYDREAAGRLFQVLVNADRVLKKFRTRFIGKASPVHFFWGSFDHAVTRFSGRRAPTHPGGIPGLPDWITREAYSHEVSSCGFWPGGESFPHALFYSYAYPAPDGFAEAKVRPDVAVFSPEMGEFVLKYDDVRQSEDPDRTLLEFLQSTYEAAAELGHWDRSALEHGEPWPKRGN